MRITVKFIGALFALWTFASCGTPGLGIYSIQMENVLCVPESETKNLMFSTRGLPDGTTEYIYEDLSIRIDLVLTNTRFAFKLMNLMPDTLLIDWEKAMYINQRNDTLRVIHNGVDLAQRTMPQDTTFLAPGPCWMISCCLLTMSLTIPPISVSGKSITFFMKRRKILVKRSLLCFPWRQKRVKNVITSFLLLIIGRMCDFFFGGIVFCFTFAVPKW
jgi:hypothetical protein